MNNRENLLELLIPLAGDIKKDIDGKIVAFVSRKGIALVWGSPLQEKIRKAIMEEYL